MEYLEIMMMERHHRLLKEAEEMRLIKEAKMYRKKNMQVKQGIIDRVMINIGEIMVKAGYHIKKRFEPVESVEPGIYSDAGIYQEHSRKKCA